MNTLFQGVGMGLAIAAPVGPIGMLCIRRSLQGGASIGLASGLGAAVADAVYGLAVAGGLALSGWLIRHAIALSLIGASVLIWMGLGSFYAFIRTKKSKGAGAESPPAGRISRGTAFGSTFALTASNPTTMVGFIGVVGTLGSTGTNAGAPYLLVMGVFLGSMVWWTTLVMVIRSAREILSVSLRWVDLATAMVLVTTGSWVLATTLLRAQARGHFGV